MPPRTPSNDVRALVTYVREQIDPDWSIHTPGWPDEIEAGLIDAVTSVRATYGGPDTGVRRVVQRWREHTGDTRLDDLPRLAATDPLDLATILGNRQRLPGNSLKAEGIVAAAEALTEAGVKRADDLCADDDEHREAVVTVVGLGPLTWGYLTVLVAAADRPADQRVTRLVGQVVGRDLDPAQSMRVLTGAAKQLGVRPATLHSVIWRDSRGAERQRLAEARCTSRPE
ncbi:MAG: hypothetical protein WCA82_11900 [Jiangellales bacterium]